ncbi:MAG: hypothetical protein WKG07_01500 [Hymenobacter sp.]
MCRTTSTPALPSNIDNTRDLASPFSEFAGVSVVAGLLYYGGTLVLSGQARAVRVRFYRVHHSRFRRC